MSKYEKFSKEELMALVEKQESELAAKKYGLVWDSEREPEQVVLDCENNLPVLKRVKNKEIRDPKDNDSEDNILIEGDNYHALTVLNYTHQEKIDVIYIDPPYNTGNQDFKYNDKFVDKEDGFRHSKWLNFIEKRLNLAKDLLKETGVIFISIDDNEFCQLKLLSDKIFGESNFIGEFVWKNKLGGGNDSKILVTEHEYILCYSKKLNEIKKFVEPNIDNGKYLYEDEYIKTRGRFALEALYRSSIQYSESLFYRIKTPDGTSIWPNESDKKSKKHIWRWSEETFKRKLTEGRVEFKKTKNGWRVFSKQYFLEDDDGNLRVLSVRSIIDFIGNRQGTELLKKIFGNDKIFNNPKPIELIKYLLEISQNKQALVLDFMAGSGTTGHAVLELNKEDGGNRKFILCTNNEVNGIEKELREKGLNEKEIQEYGICRKITYPRLERIIKGYKKNGDGEKVEGLGGNLQYFRTALVKDTKNKDQVRLDLTEKCTEMLCVKENIFNLETEKEDYKIFASNKDDKFLCVFYNLFDESFKEFLKEIKKLKGEKKIYMFSIDGTTDRKLFAGVKDCVIEEIPQKIIDIYKQMVKMNIPVKADTIFLEFEKANKKIFEDKEKDEGARILRIVLEKTIQKISQKNNINIFNNNRKEEKIATLNDKLYEGKVFNKVQWEENKTCLAIGNNASHGDYSDYTIKQVENFYQHIQKLFNDFWI